MKGPFAFPWGLFGLEDIPDELFLPYALFIIFLFFVFAATIKEGVATSIFLASPETM